MGTAAPPQLQLQPEGATEQQTQTEAASSEGGYLRGGGLGIPTTAHVPGSIHA